MAARISKKPPRRPTPRKPVTPEKPKRGGNSVDRSLRQVATQEKRVDALVLRKAGQTYEAIGERLGCSTSNAHKLVQTAIAAITIEAASDVMQLELARLDTLLEAVWVQALLGKSRYVNCVIRIMSRRAALLGLDRNEALKETETWNAGGGAPFNVNAALK